MLTILCDIKLTPAVPALSLTPEEVEIDSLSDRSSAYLQGCFGMPCFLR